MNNSTFKYIINIPKIIELEEHQISFILSLITMYFNSFNGKTGHVIAGGMKMDSVSASILESSLLSSGYLIDGRELKIDQIIQ